MIGETISHYRILEKLGEGGMGVVYRAHDTTLDRDVALKFLPHFLITDPAEKERFYHEAKAAAALTHANIAVIHEIGEHDGQLFISMEYVRGRTLKDAIAGATLPLNSILDIAVQVCEGLERAHEACIVHRDIKPANIMVTQRGEVKIMDFGLAKVASATRITRTGSTLGTAAYMSPEQARGEEVDARSDIFSFGVVLYELLTGRLPFRGEHPAALMYSIVNEEPKPISEFNHDVSPEIEQIVAKALAKDLQGRYESVSDLLGDLRGERRMLDQPEAAHPKKARVRTRPTRRLMRIGLLAAALILFVVLALVFNPFNLRVGVQQNIAEAKPSLAVMSFENIPDPADKDRTGEMLTNYLITSFFQTRDLDVVSRERLFEIQQSIEAGQNKVISPTLASQIAKRARVSTMMLASILQLQPTLTVTYRVIDVETGKIINSQRVSGYANDRLYSLADTLALMVKSDLHVTPATGGASVAEVTTKSQEAYRLYLEGVRLDLMFEDDKAEIALRKAIELDSSFALPHFFLGTGWFYADETRKAWQLRAKTTEKDRLMIEADHARFIEEDPGKAVRILDEVMEKYPRELLGYIQSSLICQSLLCDYDRALTTAKRGVQIDSLNQFALSNLIYLEAGFNRKKEAMAAIDQYARIAPESFNSYDTRGDVFTMFGELDSAIVYKQRALASNSGFWGRSTGYLSVLKGDYRSATNILLKLRGNDEQARAMIDGDLSVVAMHEGELVRASKRLNAFVLQHRRTKSRLDYMVGTMIGRIGYVGGGDLLYLVALAYEQGDYQKMLGYARERSDEIVRQQMVVGWDPLCAVNGRYEVAWALLKCGRSKEANRLMDDLKDVLGPGVPSRQREYDHFKGILAFERGEYDAALKEFNNWLSKSPVNHAPSYYYAVTLLKTGHMAEAITEFQRLTWWPAGGGPFSVSSAMDGYWPIAAAKAHYWSGLAYEQQGKRNQAVKEYRTFLEIWKNADFKSPELQDAKVRLLALKALND